MTGTYIWSLRYSPFRGWYAYKERDAVDEKQAELWLSVFRADEPSIEFVSSIVKPAIDLKQNVFKDVR